MYQVLLRSVQLTSIQRITPSFLIHIVVISQGKAFGSVTHWPHICEDARHFATLRQNNELSIRQFEYTVYLYGA
jgi:hypothetical protein